MSVNPATDQRGSLWPLLALLMLVPLWSLAVFGRGAWMPDEPREYDITLNMLQDSSFAVPHMAGEVFLEKPPLLYWAGTMLMRLSGVSVGSARAQNLVWSVLAVLAVGALAGRMAASTDGNDRRRAALASLVAALACGTMLLLFQIQIWLATDAPLLAATALSGWSAWEAVHAQTRYRRLAWYLLLAGALALAFFAKNIFGWVTPVIGLVAWTMWDKRWNVLRQPQLYIALAALTGAVGLWVWCVLRQDNGGQQLLTLLRDNTLGRFTAVSSDTGYVFGHRNHPGKFLLSLPLFVMPWTFCVLASLRWSWMQLRQSGADRSAIKYALCAFGSGVVLLMISATARDTYFGPSVLALCPLLGLWARQLNADRLERALLAANLLLARSAAVLLSAFALLIGILQEHAGPPSRFAIAVVVAAACGGGWRYARPMLAGNAAVAHVPIWWFATLIIETVAFPAIDAAENLSPFAVHAAADIAGAPTLFYCADETTLATLDAHAGVRLGNVCGSAQVERLIRDRPEQRFLSQTGVIRLSARTESLLRLIHASMFIHQHERTTPAAQLEALGLRPLVEWSTPGGRSYGLYAKPSPALAAVDPLGAGLKESASRR